MEFPAEKKNGSYKILSDGFLYTCIFGPRGLYIQTISHSEEGVSQRCDKAMNWWEVGRLMSDLTLFIGNLLKKKETTEIELAKTNVNFVMTFIMHEKGRVKQKHGNGVR